MVYIRLTLIIWTKYRALCWYSSFMEVWELSLSSGLLCMFSLRCGQWVSRRRGVFFSAGLLLLQDTSLPHRLWQSKKILPHWYHSSCSSWTTRDTLSLPLNSPFLSVTPSWVPDFGWPSCLNVRASMLILALMVQWRGTWKIWSFNPSAAPLFMNLLQRRSLFCPSHLRRQGLFSECLMLTTV